MKITKEDVSKMDANAKKNTHWRKVMNTKYLNGDELPENGSVVTIVEAETVEIFSPKTRDKEEHTLLKFKAIDKPMILTNRKAKQLSQVVGSALMADWIGEKIHIYPKQEKHFGEWFPVINVKKANVVKPTLDEKSEGWKKACEAVRSGSMTVEGIEKHYKLSAKTKKQLTALKNESDDNLPKQK